SIRDKKLALDPARIDAIERTTKHDVIAFLTHVEELAGSEARWLHRGMTSSDVLDTSLAVLLVRAADLLLERLDKYVAALARRARRRRAPAAAEDRPQPRHARGAHHVRARARRPPRRGQAGPRPPPRGARGDRGRQDRRRGRHLRAPLACARGARPPRARPRP